jgi:thioredoxin-dependent peroxiredoxin
MSRPVPGDPVPPFRMRNDVEEEVSNETLAGRRYVLYFYPKDDTPGCTTQACSLRDHWDTVAGTGVLIFGVSPDSVASHVKFRAKYGLPYPLLADEGHRTADAFGVWVSKSKMGRTYMGVERTTFVIGPDGRIEHVLPDVKPAEHVDLLMEVLATA